jgi:NAD(P)-dependent dehydrogenase (short-subunit alcohol dehydrogenase family)
VGGTTGLGLASAVHFLNLGAKEVIITARSASRGQAAKEQIEAQTNARGQGKVAVMDVDMCRYSSVVAFIDQLKSKYSDHGGLDCAILSAGTHNAEFVLSPGRW